MHFGRGDGVGTSRSSTMNDVPGGANFQQQQMGNMMHRTGGVGGGNNMMSSSQMSHMNYINQQQRMHMNQQHMNSHPNQSNGPQQHQMSQQQMHHMQQQHQRMLNHQRMMMMNAANQQHNSQQLSSQQLMRPSGPNMSKEYIVSNSLYTCTVILSHFKHHIYILSMVIGMNMGFNPGGPMYGMNNNNSQRRPTPYPNPMYMQAKRLQQPTSAFPASSSGMVSSFD